jgi:hypothetical protein
MAKASPVHIECEIIARVMAKAGVRMMHRLLLATVATISLVLAAGDVTPARAAPPVPYSWTGFYVGGNFGGGWGNTGYSGGQSTGSTSFLTSLAAVLPLLRPWALLPAARNLAGFLAAGRSGTIINSRAHPGSSALRRISTRAVFVAHRVTVPWRRPQDQDQAQGQRLFLDALPTA